MTDRQVPDHASPQATARLGLLTLFDVAARLNVSERTVRREVRAKRLRCVRLRRRLLFDPADVSRFVVARKE
jgi:excisionase family DNA binding protein